jgi:PHD/YefM family antitoxin component YafN of YafNO toxin-antitoxin module
MKMIASQEIKRRGMAAVDKFLGEGPISIVKNNRPLYVLMSEAEYEMLMDDLAEARLAASVADVKAGRVRKGTAADLLAELHKEK